MKLKFGNKSIDFRVSTLPTLFGEKLVVRVLATDLAQLQLDQLGYGPVEKQRMLSAIHKTQGLIVVAICSCFIRLNRGGVAQVLCSLPFLFHVGSAD